MGNLHAWFNGRRGGNGAWVRHETFSSQSLYFAAPMCGRGTSLRKPCQARTLSTMKAVSAPTVQTSAVPSSRHRATDDVVIARYDPLAAILCNAYYIPVIHRSAV